LLLWYRDEKDGIESRGIGGVLRDALARWLLKYARWSSIFALPASTAARVGSMWGTGVVAILVGLGEEKPDVFLFFRGRGGEISRAKLDGTLIVVEEMFSERLVDLEGSLDAWLLYD
jgi:hypothetical protein